MTNGQPVLVATDLSARSDRAVDRALMLAEQWGVQLIVLHALEAGSYLEGKLEAAERSIRATLRDPDADVSILPAVGAAPSVIVDAATSAACSLIVTGVARFNNVGDYFIGTAVDHVVRHATVPVLIVKNRPRKPYAKVLIATDYSNCSRAALTAAVNLFPNAEIHVIHAYHVPYEGWLSSQQVKDEVADGAKQQLDSFIASLDNSEDISGRISAHLGYGETPSVIIRAVSEIGVDLVVLGTHGRSGFVRSVVGSMAEELLQILPVDTLVVRTQS
ncbi:universal stress protein [Sphingorhabdus sp.]|uniref:universal stress protein n=1 Tax=Sphingorhabdus sp. TaxID=1902408 RepID=UPI00391DDFD3